MSNILKVDLDDLTIESAQKIAGLILAYAGLDEAESIQPANDDPEKVFTNEPEPVGEPEPEPVGEPEPAPVGEPEPEPPALDKAGFRWDARIHSANRSLNADGTWRSKRGVDDAFRAQVEAELRGVSPAPGPTIVAPPPPPPPPAPAAPTYTPEQEVALRQKFIDLMGRTSAAIGAGKLSPSQVQQVAMSVGIAGLPLLNIRLDLIDQVAPMIDALIAAQA